MKIFDFIRKNKSSSDDQLIDIENRLSKLERDINSCFLGLDDKFQYYLDLRIGNLEKVFNKKKAGRPKKNA